MSQGGRGLADTSAMRLRVAGVRSRGQRVERVEAGGDDLERRARVRPGLPGAADATKSTTWSRRPSGGAAVDVEELGRASKARPPSSRASRTAASRQVSPASTAPPGEVQAGEVGVPHQEDPAPASIEAPSEPHPEAEPRAGEASARRIASWPRRAGAARSGGVNGIGGISSGPRWRQASARTSGAQARGREVGREADAHLLRAGRRGRSRPRRRASSAGLAARNAAATSAAVARPAARARGRPRAKARRASAK